MRRSSSRAPIADCAVQVRTALSRTEGIKFIGNDIQPGKEPRYSTEPFVIKIADSGKTPIGDLARAVSEARTPHKKEFPPILSLILYPTELPDVMAYETALSTFRTELKSESGVDAEKTGALGGVPDRGFLWLDLAGAGGADLDGILTAAKRADLKVSLEKP